MWNPFGERRCAFLPNASFPLAEANTALQALRKGALQGAAVLVP